MNHKIPKPVFSTPAVLWDGTRQLLGILELWETEILFLLNDFKQSHLNLTIPLSEIEHVDEYLVFDLSRNGIKIQNKKGMIDLFIMDDVTPFKTILKHKLTCMK